MSNLVADASAVLAVACREPGAEQVLAVRPSLVISAVNHLEVISCLLRTADLPRPEIDQFLHEAFPNVLPFDRDQADLAGRLHAVTRKQNLSYADCACLALGQVRQWPVLTGDRKWLELGLPQEIRLFR